MTPTTFRPGDDQSGSARTLKDLDHGRSRNLGNWRICSRYFRLATCFRKLKRKQWAPLRWWDSALLPRDWMPGPRPRPIESGPCGWGPDRGISLMMPTCSQAGSCHPGASTSLAAALHFSPLFCGCPVHLCRGAWCWVVMEAPHGGKKSRKQYF